VKRVRASPKLASVRQQVGAVIGDNPYLSIEEVRSRLDVKVSWSTVWRCMKALKLSYKEQEETARAREKTKQMELELQIMKIRIKVCPAANK
jgi:transposase